MNSKILIIVFSGIILLSIWGMYVFVFGTGSKVPVGIPVGADKKTFVSLCSGDTQCGWGKDKKHVYYNGQIVESADPNTFELLDNFYATDASHVYYVDRATKVPLVISGDSSSFKNLGG